MENDAEADGLQLVIAVIRMNGADPELGQADIHNGSDLQVDAGKGLVGDTTADILRSSEVAATPAD